jgi:hypothetical protein
MKNFIKTLFLSVLVLVLILPSISLAQDRPKASDDPTSSDFRLVWCDGPRDLVKYGNLSETEKNNFVPCDFAGAMGQVQHLINIMLGLGVLSAIVLFCWAGYLYIQAATVGKEEGIKDAKVIFKKVIVGFVIMICAWFIVYQLLAWLAKSSTATALL